MIKRETFLYTDNNWMILGEILIELLTLKVTQKHVFIMITEQELDKNNLLQDLYQWIEQGIFPHHIDSEFRRSIIKCFKDALKPGKLYEYIKNGDSNNIDEDMIIAELQQDIQQRLHFCFDIKSYKALKTLEEDFPRFREKFKAIYPFCGKAVYQEQIVQKLMPLQKNAIRKMYSIARQEVFGSMFTPEYIDSVLNSEKLAASYESLGTSINLPF